MLASVVRPRFHLLFALAWAAAYPVVVRAAAGIDVQLDTVKGGALQIDISASNAESSEQVDVYLVAKTADGRFYSFPGWSPGLRPWLQRVELSAPFNYARQMVTRIAAMPVKKATFYAALTKPGTLDILALDEQTIVADAAVDAHVTPQGGSGVTIDVSATNDGVGIMADVYLVRETEGKFYAFPGWTKGLRPWLTNQAIPASFNYPRQRIAQASLPPGRHTIHVGLTAPGTLDIIALDSETVVISTPVVASDYETIPNNDEEQGIICGTNGKKCFIQKRTRKVFEYDSAVNLATEVPGAEVDEGGNLLLEKRRKGRLYLANSEELRSLAQPVSLMAIAADSSDAPPADDSGKTAVFVDVAADNTLRLVTVDVTDSGEADVQTSAIVVPGKPPVESTDPPLPADNDNSIDRARPLAQVAFPQTVSSNLDLSDYYTVSAQAGETFTITLDFGSQDLDLLLYDQSGALIDESASRSGRRETIVSQSSATSTYYLRVYAHETAGLAVEYTLRADYAPPETDADNNGDFTIGRRFDISGNASTSSDRLASNDLIDFWWFDAVQSSQHAIDLGGFAGNLDLALYSDAKTVIASSNSAGSTAERIQAALTKGKRYYIRVKGDGTSTPYSLKVAYQQPPVDDNNSFDAAKALSNPLRSDVNSDGDRDDFWALVPAGDAQYTMELDNSRLRLRLYNSARVEIAASSGGSSAARIVQNLDGGKVYYVRVDAASSTGLQAYTLGTAVRAIGEPDNDNSVDTATEVPEQTTRSSTVDTFNDQRDFYKFKPGACRNQSITLDFENNANLDLFLYGPGEGLIAKADTQSNTNRRESLAAGASKLSPGQWHYVEVYAPYTASPVQYSLTLNPTLVDDGDNSRDAAKSVQAPYEGSLELNCDPVDWLTFALPAGNAPTGGDHTLKLTSATSGHMKMRLYSACCFIGESDAGGELAASLDAGQPYWLEVSAIDNGGWAGPAEPYTVDVIPPKPMGDIEPNNSVDEARQRGLLSDCTRISGVVSKGDLDDFFLFNASRSDAWSFKLTFSNPELTSFIDLDLALCGSGITQKGNFAGCWSETGARSDSESIEQPLAAGREYILHVGLSEQRGAQGQDVTPTVPYTLEFCYGKGN